jgi:hypothetical protein
MKISMDISPVGFIRQMFIEVPTPLSFLGGILRVNYKSHKVKNDAGDVLKVENIFTVRALPNGVVLPGTREERTEIWAKQGWPMDRFEKTCDFISWMEKMFYKEKDALVKAKSYTTILMNAKPERE